MYYATKTEIGTADALPDGAIEITAEQYQEALSRMDERRTVIAGDLVYYQGPVYLVDADGYHTGQSDELSEGAELITDPPPAGLVKPRWSDGKWIEGESAAVLFEIAKTDKLAEINRASQAAADTYMANYPEFETLTWEAQEREARAYQADNGAATPTLIPIAQARGITMADLAQRVINKADAFRAAAAELMGKRQMLEDKVSGIAADLADNMITEEQALAVLSAIQWEDE